MKQTRRFLSAIIAIFMLSMCFMTSFAKNVEEERAPRVQTQDFSSNSGARANTMHNGTRTQNKTEYFLGDVNLDGKVNTGDATTILRYCVDLIALSELQLTVGDVNENGYVNTGDATIVLCIVVGLTTGGTITIGEPEPTNTADVEPSVSPTVPPTGEPTVPPTGEPTTPPTGEPTVPPTAPATPPDVITYSVTYVGGIDGMDFVVPQTVRVEPGKAYYVDELVPNAIGYEFLGWRNSVDGYLYQGGDAFVMPQGNVVLTAEWNKLSGTAVAVKITDAFNEQLIVDTFVMLNESGIVRIADFSIPSGYKALNPEQMYDVVVGNNGAWPALLQFDIFKYENTDEGEFILLDNANAVDNIRLDLTRNYKITCDIDMGELGQFRPIGWQEQTSLDDIPFTGILDGGGHTLSKMLCDYWDINVWSYTQNVGLIAVNRGTIKNVNIFTMTTEQNPDAYGIFGYNNIGGIAGMNYGLVANCLVQGHVGSSNSDNADWGIAGGIVGFNDTIGRIVRCGSNVGIEGFYYIGGVAGQNAGTIEQCWFAGGINSIMENDMLQYFGVRCIGGISGGNMGNVYDTYVILMSELCGYDGVGGISGWARDGHISNFYIAFESNLYAMYGMYFGTYLGYVVSGCNPTTSGLYSFNSVSSLPETFSSNVWDMNGASYSNLPDLVYIRRPEA